MSLAERIRTLFHEQCITIFSILTALPMTISTTFLSITGVFGGVGGGRGGRGGGTRGFPPKGKGPLKRWLGKLADALKRLPGKVVEALSAIV